MIERATSRGRLFTGVILIALGALFLLDQFAVIRLGEFLATWWPAILIAAGLWWLVFERTRHTFSALTLIVVGVIFQIDQLRLFPWRTACPCARPPMPRP
jgi:hypothetical protein